VARTGAGSSGRGHDRGRGDGVEGLRRRGAGSAAWSGGAAPWLACAWVCLCVCGCGGAAKSFVGWRLYAECRDLELGKHWLCRVPDHGTRQTMKAMPSALIWHSAKSLFVLIQLL